jgi:hypothetical protein
VAEGTDPEYIFDPDKYGKKDPTLVTENYRLDPRSYWSTAGWRRNSANKSQTKASSCLVSSNRNKMRKR